MGWSMVLNLWHIKMSKNNSLQGTLLVATKNQLKNIEILVYKGDMTRGYLALLSSEMGCSGSYSNGFLLPFSFAPTFETMLKPQMVCMVVFVVQLL